jgi:MerR family transcriptional regulator, redox-sensitive transcriptional activator SoxR
MDFGKALAAYGRVDDWRGGAAGGPEPSALRYYESIGLLPAPRRVNGRRPYDARTLQQLTALRFAQQAGFTIAEMEALFHGFAPETLPAARWQALAEQKLGEQKLGELDALIEQGQHMRERLRAGLGCGCVRMEDCLIVEGEEGCRG